MSSTITIEWIIIVVDNDAKGEGAGGMLIGIGG